MNEDISSNQELTDDDEENLVGARTELRQKWDKHATIESICTVFSIIRVTTNQVDKLGGLTKHSPSLKSGGLFVSRGQSVVLTGRSGSKDVKRIYSPILF